MCIRDSFEVAIEEGATLLRVGTALFEDDEAAPPPATAGGAERGTT